VGPFAKQRSCTDFFQATSGAVTTVAYVPWCALGLDDGPALTTWEPRVRFPAGAPCLGSGSQMVRHYRLCDPVRRVPSRVVMRVIHTPRSAGRGQPVHLT